MRCCLRATGQWNLPLIDLKRGKKKRRWRTEQNPCWPESSRTSLQLYPQWKQLQSRPSGAYLVLFALLAESISPGKNKTNNEYEIWLQIGIKFTLLFTPNPQNSFTSCDKKVSAQESAWIHQVDKLHGSSICSVCLTKKHKIKCRSAVKQHHSPSCQNKCALFAFSDKHVEPQHRGL